MVTTRDGGNDASPEPLVGRGNARRGEPSGPVPVDAVDGEGDGHRERSWVPRPTLSPSSRGRRWLDAGAQIPRARLALGLVLVVGLAAAWMMVSRPAPASAPVSIATSTTVARTQPQAENVVTVPRWVPAAIAATCEARGVDESQSIVVDCTPGRGVARLRYRGFSSVASMRAAYDAASPRGGGDGPSECARGGKEERSWSVAEAPSEPNGRYRCSLVAGRARLVWSSERSRVLAIASRADGDLRSLYEWWTTVPGPNDP